MGAPTGPGESAAPPDASALGAVDEPGAGVASRAHAFVESLRKMQPFSRTPLASMS